MTRLARKPPSIRSYLVECFDRKQALFWPSHDDLFFGCMFASGRFVAVQAAELGADEHPDFADIRTANGIAFVVSRSGGQVYVRGRSGQDMPVDEGETVLDTYMRLTGAGPKAFRVVAPIGNGIPIAVTDGQISIGADGDGVHSATTIAIPKLDEMKSNGAAMLRRMGRG